MAHFQQIQFLKSVKNKFPNYFSNVNVLDCGSLDINGNNRYLFDNYQYTGIDIGHGPNVDIVCKIHEFEGDGNLYDVVVSSECFEHDQFYEKSLQNMFKLLKPGGMMLFTCATEGRPEHGTRRTSPSDSPFTSNQEGWSDYYKIHPEHLLSIHPFHYQMIIPPIHQ